MIKADFHLHTYHSDNQDRMTPAEYVARARALGYGALGFCDHHHNLTDDAWRILRDEVAALQSPDLLLTTGYEATWMAGHLCVLDQEEFNAGTYAECMPLTWSPANLRILAHPDNNLCAWLLPLPVGVQGVEVINGGQDPYSVRSDSPCNGLDTFRRYLALDHPVAAIGQSDCHRRAVFGRAWTGLVPPYYTRPEMAQGASAQGDYGQEGSQAIDDVPFDRAAMHAALLGHHTIAVMGDLSVQLWCENETPAGPGETVEAAPGATLRWQVPPGTTVQLWLADRLLAEFAPADGIACHTVAHNGPHWLLCRRGLHWAVTSPIWIFGMPGADAAARARLHDHRGVQAAAARLQQRLEWLQQAQAEAPLISMPVDAYVAWAARLLPQNWRGDDAAWSGVGDPVDWAMLRLAVMDRTLQAVLCDLVRGQARATGAPLETPAALIATAGEPVPAGTYQFYLEMPRSWAAWRLVDAAGEEVTAAAEPTAGMREPLHGPRQREQMFELIPWLQRGEIHEYRLHDVHLAVEGPRVALTADLWPAALEEAQAPPATYPAEAARLQALLADEGMTEFFVHLRMPKSYRVALKLDVSQAAARYLVCAEPTPPLADHAAALMGPDALATDPSERTVICQIR